MEFPDLTDLAKDLIRETGGEITDKNVNGTVEVFNGIIQGCHNNWEQHLAKETTAVLARDRIRCSCGAKINVIRERSIVIVKEQ